ncbi:MAG: hypothetical protein ONB31_12690 [candidate division KSB1 bacterium]|nr:hypothetical protein [candidate division KSB1 bacterium]MDZ7336653.1 hypothetical protein [candidate division KSB1 bacterium]
MRISFRATIIIGWIILICSFGISADLQDLRASGFELIIVHPDANDTTSKFIHLDVIKSLPIHSVELPDHKTKENIMWQGVYLRDFIWQSQQIDWSAIRRLVIRAPDGYSSAITGPRMKQAETAMCAFAIKNKKWSQKFGDMRIIFPDLHEMHWVNNPSKIELVLETKSPQPSIWRFFFFDLPAFQSLRDSISEKFSGWSVNQVLTAMGCAGMDFGVFTFDGHLKEYLFDEIAQRMKLSPDSSGTLKVRGEKVPFGFRLRKIFFLFAGNVALFARSLTNEEAVLWQNLFALIDPLANQGVIAKGIFVVSNSGEKIPATNYEAYRSGEISLYQLLENEKQTRSDLVSIEIGW